MLNGRWRASLFLIAALSATGCSAGTPEQSDGASAQVSGVPSDAVSTASPERPGTSASAVDEEGAATAAKVDTSALPEDVRAFIERRSLCDHFRGEEPYDAERKAFLEQKLQETCKGTDAALKGIRRKYHENPDVIAALWDYDSVVE
ncbi:hypothetical protein HGI47_17860 [Novosphingobium sp. ERN07]|uniref:hypothetical protein n=1 Tax=Novosphingobium sp. ERN07 TaxID=2726187 RepID=UPI00145640D0|nr:hypothetical protein [Novosphingobium sp. ERN07]NLR72744.1 hypothetical protein [Novosphingobium sp. ERN07]